VFRLDSHQERLKRTAADIAARLFAASRDAPPRLWVLGATGSGRRTVVDHLRSDARIVAIELRELSDIDAPLHGLVQAATHLPGFESLIADHDVDGELDVDLRRRAANVARLLARAHKAIAIVVPESWTDTDGIDDVAIAHRARSFLRGLLEVDDLGVAIVGSLPGELGSFDRIQLERIRLRSTDVALDATPATLRDAAERLVRHMQAIDGHGTPLELRLRLGLVKLGLAPDSIGDLQLMALSKQLARKLPRELAIATRRLLLARGPIPRATVPRLTGLHDTELDLIMTCVAYGDAAVRVPDQTRAVLLEQFRYLGHRAPASELEEGHGILAAHYQSLDGQNRIDGLAPDHAVAWMEKVHHLAHGGPATEGLWAAQQLFSRELIWAHARSLSRRRQYVSAAGLYSESLSKFGDHSYAHHYLAFNLDRAHGDRGAIEHHYRTAVRLDEQNPWWNTRLVTFLIAHGTYEDARREWRAATERVDPTGKLLEERSWLALNMHRWVARRWLTLGYLSEARDVLDEIPPRFVEQESVIALLSQEIEDAEEAHRLGDSVYPPDVPMEQRWKTPRVLVDRTASGAHLEAWWAGRVMEVDASRVLAVLAQPEEAQQLAFTLDEWQTLTGEAAQDARGYIELGRYSDGSRIIRRVPSVPPAADSDELDYVMGRISRWPD
jgi:tetratricopeptide (TPR) repeat protein